jgi:hypothetical protein
MKKFMFVSIVLFVFCSRGESQLIRDYGLKLGMASTNQNWDYSPSTSIKANSSSRQSIDAGIFVEWINVPLISILTEVHYIQKGADFKTNILVTTIADPEGTGENYTFSSKVDYLSIPLLVKIRMDNASFSPYIFAGPRFDLFLKDHSAGLGIILAESKKVDVGGTFGLGVELSSLLPIHVGAEIRYSPSFQDIYSVSYLKVKNRSLEFLLVISF